MHSTFRYIPLTVAILVWLSGSAIASASYQSCLALYRAGKYIKASQCLRSLVATLDQQKNLTKEQRLTKGSAIRSAAIALRKAAEAEAKIERAGYLRAQAIKLLLRYEREKLAPNMARQKSTRRIRLQLQEALKLTPLSVIGGAATAKLTIQGYQFKATAKGKWLQSVRPGRYTITARYSDGSSKHQRLTVTPGNAAFATFQPPASRRVVPPTRRVVTPPRRVALRRRVPPPPPAGTSPARLTGWILLGVGAAAMAGSIAPFALLQSANADLTQAGTQYSNDCANKATPGPSTCSDLSQQIRDTHSNAQTLQTAGFAVLGAGVVLAIVGVVLVALPGPKAPASDAQVLKQRPLSPRAHTWLRRSLAPQ